MEILAQHFASISLCTENHHSFDISALNHSLEAPGEAAQFASKVV
jgi:hypothetical protein